ncbi:hypothetical protein [Gryllotalpicola kribbensis]
MMQTTRPPTSSQPAAPEALGLSHILTSLLPPTVHTSDGPERYIVSAVFNRRPSAGEITGINGAAARSWLDRAQFPEISLKVSDRRLEIANTSLEQLASGLAATIAGLLAHLSAEDATQAHSAAGDLADHEQSEQRRLAAINALIAEIPLSASVPSDEQPQLGLARIATGLLPSALGTDSAFPRYTVSVEFTRAPTPREIEMITGTSLRQQMSVAGYPEAVLTIRDRRLEIHGTSLEELRAGLADVISSALIGISSEAATRDVEAAADAARQAEQESNRQQYVTTAAAAVRFVAPRD